MGLFGKKKKKEELRELPELPKSSNLPELPEINDDEDYNDLPEFPTLPKLPKLPELPKDFSKSDSSKLPRYPANKFSDKFSQDTIKGAVTGGKEVEEEANDFAIEQMMPELPKMNLNKKQIPMPSQKLNKNVLSGNYKSKSPVFIRVDKFEEGLKIFEEVKEKIIQIEGLVEDVKQIKEKEEKELLEWESQIQSMKNQIEKVEKDLFSKIE